MKNRILLFVFSLCISQLMAQVSWTKMASLPGPGRNHAISFANGTKGYVMTGEGGINATQYKDFWEYNSLTDTWTQLPNYPGPVRSYGAGYVINGKAYIGLGNSAGSYIKDWWEYDFSTTTWTQKNNFPGTGRDHPVIEVMNGMLYMGFGDAPGVGSINDWWQYNPTTDTWTAKAAYPGLKMHHPVAAAYNNLIYVSEGHIVSSPTNTGSKKFYSFNTTNNTWTTLTDMPGPGVVAGASFYIGGGKVYSGCGITEPAGAFHQEFYAYDITAATWSAIQTYPGLGVFGPVSFAIGNAGYVVTGQDASGTDTKDLYKLAGLVAVDAGVPSVTTPSGTICSSSFVPVVIIQNFGTTTLTSCTVNYHIDSNPNQTQAWTGSLASGASTAITLPSQSASAGAHTFTSSTSSPNGSTDGNASNDQVVSNFNVNTTAGTLPLVEGFEGNGTSLPTGWSLWNPNANTAWTVNASVGHTGTHSIEFDNCAPTTDITGQRDRFITTPYDFSAATSANMAFDVAYAALTLSGNTYTDSLAVYSSTDCGTTWTQIYYKGGANLATAPNMTVSSPTCFTPTSSQWRTDNTALNSLIGQSSVMFAFENRSQWGEGIYIDNINITSATGIAPVNSTEGFTIYPNPVRMDSYGASTSFTLQGESNSGKIHYGIFNVVGEEVRAGDIASGGGGFNGKVQINDLSRGMYFIRVNDGINTWTKKLNVQ
jgi:N-acetylneuraminic acid mutarotase